MIPGRMSRSVRVFLVAVATTVIAAVATGCGTQKLQVARSQHSLYTGAQLFSQRCGGCHTLSYAGTHGSAPNVRTAQAINGPNFNVRCERPVTRVLYAIQNGGFSGAYMPQNVVVGQDAVDVAQFVSTYAGRQAPPQAGVPNCQAKPIGSLPAGSGTIDAGATTSSSTTTTTSATSTATTAASASATGKSKTQKKKKTS
jgi:mono/diheme cytochrome c family protein